QQQAVAKESAAKMGDYYKALAKAAKKVTDANAKLAQAWAEADAALKDLRTARSHARRINAKIEPAGDAINNAVQQAWKCAHTPDMPSVFYAPLQRDSVASALGHRTHNVAMVPGQNDTV